jgi:hypothetical protein
MSGQHGWAVAILLLSIGLSTGSVWLKQKPAANQTWRIIEEPRLGQAARFFYFVGLPYLAVILGVLTTRMLGLKGLENVGLFDGGNLAAGLQTVLVLMLLEWLVDSSATIIIGLAALVILGGLRLSLARSGIRLGAGYRATVVDTVYQALHWAFYRAVIWLLSGDLYLAVVLGAGLVLAEWLLVTWVRQAWADRQQAILAESLILILTAAIFYYSPNLWLLWPFHLAMVVLIRNSTVGRGWGWATGDGGVL